MLHQGTTASGWGKSVRKMDSGRCFPSWFLQPLALLHIPCTHLFPFPSAWKRRGWKRVWHHHFDNWRLIFLGDCGWQLLVDKVLKVGGVICANVTLASDSDLRFYPQTYFARLGCKPLKLRSINKSKWILIGGQKIPRYEVVGVFKLVLVRQHSNVLHIQNY